MLNNQNDKIGHKKVGKSKKHTHYEPCCECGKGTRLSLLRAGLCPACYRDAVRWYTVTTTEGGE